MARHTKFGWWKDQQSAVINAETLTVTLTGTTTVATIYAAEVGGSAITNGVITLSTVGFFQFWVDDGAPDNYPSTQKFRLTFTGAKFKTLTLDDIVIFPGITTTSTDTFTNKTIDADNNTITNLEHGAEVDNLSSGIHGVTGSVVGTTDTQTLSAKTLITPTVGDLSDMTHDHQNAAGGGATLTSTTLTSPVLNTAVSGTAVLDEDDMSSDSNTQISTQQSIKKYVDDNTITLGTEQASGSGTAIDFTSIPSGVQKITIMPVGVSLDGTEQLLIQIGDTDGIETSGYLGAAQRGATAANSTAGFIVVSSGAAAAIHHGSIILTLEDSAAFTWVSNGHLARSDAALVDSSGGSKSLSKELDRVRITSTGTPDDFDAGAINIQYE